MPVHLDFDITGKTSSRVDPIVAPVNPLKYSDIMREVEAITSPSIDTGSGDFTKF
jgi:hypothetical protein